MSNVNRMKAMNLENKNIRNGNLKEVNAYRNKQRLQELARLKTIADSVPPKKKF